MENILKAAFSALGTAYLWSAMKALDDAAETAGPALAPFCILAAIGLMVGAAWTVRFVVLASVDAYRCGKATFR